MDPCTIFHPHSFSPTIRFWWTPSIVVHVQAPASSCSPPCLHSFYQKQRAKKEQTLILSLNCKSANLQSKVVHFLIRRIGQPRVVSEILTGVLAGAVVSKIGPLGGDFQGNSRNALAGVASIGRNLYMFMIGLELDPAFLWQSSKKASLIMVSTLCVSTVISLGLTPLAMSTLETKIGYSRFVFLFTVVIAGTSAPTAVRAAAELKLATIDVGRLTITTSILSDMVVFLIVGMDPGQTSIGVTDIANATIILAMSVAFAMYVWRPLLRWMDRRNHGREINNFQFGVLIVVLLGLTMGGSQGSSEIFFAFFVGLAFPKTGKLGRSVVRRMRSPVHEILLPLLFAYGSMQADLRNVRARDMGLVVAIVVLSLVGKILGTCVCRLLGVPWAQTIVMGLLLNVKGQVDLIILSRTVSHDKAEQELFLVAIISAIINTVITPPLVMAIVKLERRNVAGYKAVGLELLPPESELRMLTAAHLTASLPSLLSLVEGIRGPFASPTSVYFMQLIELTDANASVLLQEQGDKSSSVRGRPVSLAPADSSVSAAAADAVATADDEEDVNSGSTLSSDARQIGIALSNFRQATGISIRQVKAISSFSNMHEDICNGAEDLRASVIIMPFHKQQGVDGAMATVNEGHRSVNERVIRYARCTVGILIDRGLGLAVQGPAAPGLLYQVGVLFFGGPDDREALAYAARMVEHPGVRLTVVRFLPCNEEDYANALEMQAARENRVLTKIREHVKDRAADDAYLANFYTRYVAAGSVSYLEKYVANCVETGNAVGGLQHTYDLLVVGKGSTEGTPLTAGMADWVECPELGHIGDLLASTDFGYPGSVLIVRQCKDEQNAEEEDDFA